MRRKVLVTGGAGFIGSNLVDSLLSEGYHVKVFDSLSRPGTESNMASLRSQYRESQLSFIKADVRDFKAVQAAALGADIIYHLAGQVAVTTSVAEPATDFEINALGTINVLEAARLSDTYPIVVFTSTNKVYGCLDKMAVLERSTCYEYRKFPNGIPETQPLDFHSPYGCSKGAADQYVRDYARIYELPTVVFRMSCIYGPRQFGTEDQGWLAYFMIAAVNGWPITIYGDGKQVRDVLFIDDLVRALRLAVDKIDTTAGEVYNIGGGSYNQLSIWEDFGKLLEELMGEKIPVRFSEWRPGDQPCYISDIRKADRHMGWRPLIDKETGIRELWKWVSSNKSFLQKILADDGKLMVAQERT